MSRMGAYRMVNLHKTGTDRAVLDPVGAPRQRS